MTIHECAIVQAYTGCCMLEGNNANYFYKYLEEIIGRPVYTHDLANKDMQKLIEAKSKPDFIMLCQNVMHDEWSNNIYEKS